MCMKSYVTDSLLTLIHSQTHRQVFRVETHVRAAKMALYLSNETTQNTNDVLDIVRLQLNVKDMLTWRDLRPIIGK